MRSIVTCRRLRDQQLPASMHISRLSAAAACCVLLSACCTKVDCELTTYPLLYIRITDSTTTDHMLHYGRLDRGTHLMIDSYSERVGTVTHFTPWFFKSVRNEQWANFDYTIRPDSSMHTDTVSQIGYALQVDKVQCNTCFLADGHADVVTYRDLTFLYRGVTQHDSVTLVTGP